MAEAGINRYITLDVVKEWIRDGIAFSCRYDLVGATGDGKPRYRCVYTVGEEESLLVAAKVGRDGPTVREFALWPGLVNHHTAYGDGHPVSLDMDLSGFQAS